MNDEPENVGPLPDPRARFDDVARRLDECEGADVAVSLTALGEAEAPAHAGGCDACREILEERRAVVRHLDLLPKSRAHFRAPKRWSWIPAAAAALVAVALVPLFLPGPAEVIVVEPEIALDEESIAVAASKIQTLPEIRELGEFLRAAKGSDQRYRATRILVHIGGRAAEQELLRTDLDAFIIAALGEMRSRDAVPRLIQALENSSLRRPAGPFHSL